MNLDKYAEEIAVMLHKHHWIGSVSDIPKVKRLLLREPILARLAAEARREGVMSVCDYLDKHMDNSSALYWLPIIGRLAHADAPKENK